MMNYNFFNNDLSNEYHTLTQNQDKTKEEARRLEVLKKLAKCQGYIVALNNLSQLDNVNILEYDNVPGLYRIQTMINGRFKTVARVKIAKRDVYILVRESTAKDLGKEYEIINYNLPAGYHVDQDLYNELVNIVNYHQEKQSA